MKREKKNTTKILRQPETVGKSIAGDDMKYGDKIIRMEGVIVEVHDGCVGIDLKGRLGYLKVPMRMLITDYPVKVGQEVVWNMSFVEQMGPEINEKYMSNLMTYQKRQEKMRANNRDDEEVTQ